MIDVCINLTYHALNEYIFMIPLKTKQNKKNDTG